MRDSPAKNGTVGRYEVVPATMSTESESASSRGGPATKKPKRASKWQHEWKRYNMSESRKGSSYVHCVPRGQTSRGRKEAHCCETASHSTITALFQNDRDTISDKIIAAEIYCYIRC